MGQNCPNKKKPISVYSAPHTWGRNKKVHEKWPAENAFVSLNTIYTTIAVTPPLES